ncbi:WxL domain-containing protein [Lactiplantibacillus sp. WILCCON 0030]|uniref:WxL domain-containing protein n=1 Tax=Lactiplantibacillus brownii TaxID=3069269 RepID=A0ABU1ADZ2_9LACO|nr:WxL domain-containing protein [Lactiplantibacillus brownii]MDQ7938617.1 WxL domain-containing protein [Lactiplantibacillus brownii]
MKKTIGTLIAGMSLFAVLPLAAQAADTDTQKDTTAEINLTQDETAKEITLEKAPTINLGEHVNDLASQDYTAEEVTDLVEVKNPGNISGWHVGVSATAFQTSGSTGTLRGAALTFKKGTVAAADNNNASKAPTAKEVTINTESQPILSADENEGIGVYDMSHTTDQVSLLVPAGNSAGAYKSTLTWTLSNAPSGIES